MIPESYLCKEDEEHVGAIENVILITGEDLAKNTKKIIDDIVFPLRTEQGTFEKKFKGVKNYAFTSVITLTYAIQKALTNKKLIKRLARDTYVYDEDESFTEVFDVREVLGTATNAKGKLVKASKVQIEAAPMYWTKEGTIARSKKTGLPFRIRDIRLVV